MSCKYTSDDQLQLQYKTTVLVVKIVQGIYQYLEVVDDMYDLSHTPFTIGTHIA